MASSGLESRTSANPFHDLVAALEDRRGDIDIRLDHVTLHLPMIPQALELNGEVSMSIHFRSLSDKEKNALSSKEVRRLQK